MSSGLREHRHPLAPPTHEHACTCSFHDHAVLSLCRRRWTNVQPPVFRLGIIRLARKNEPFQRVIDPESRLDRVNLFMQWTPSTPVLPGNQVAPVSHPTHEVSTPHRAQAVKDQHFQGPGPPSVPNPLESSRIVHPNQVLAVQTLPT